jgi:opacity protein-like surface antigen
MIKKSAFVALCLLATSPAFAQTEGWASVGGGINVNGGRFTGQARLGLDTSLGETMFVGFGVGIGVNGAKDCVNGFFVTGDRVCVKGDREYSVEGRFGTATKGGSKIYLLGGYSNLGLKADLSLNRVNVSTAVTGFDGFTVGAGWQTTLGKSLFLRTEYRYGSYNDGVSTHTLMPSIGLKF